jgi:multiple sugar transport system substrate-binding protein
VIIQSKEVIEQSQIIACPAMDNQIKTQVLRREEPMFKRLPKMAILVLVIAAMMLSACEPAPAPTPTPEPVVVTEAPVEEVKPSIDPTGQTVSFWHVWGTGLPNETMIAIVDEFNTSNEWGITVEAVDQGGYSDLEDAFNAAIQSGDLPDLAVGYTNAVANWYSVGAVADMAPFMSDPVLGLTAEDLTSLYDPAINGGKIADGTQVAFPISQSANVLFYNSQWAKELGFANAPTNYEEFKAQTCAATEANKNDADPNNDGTGGLVLYTGASNVASFVFANGGNMLSADGMAYDFASQPVVDVAEFWKDLYDSGCVFQTESYPNPEFASRKALFTMSSTAGLPYQVSAFDAEGAVKDEWTLIPFPGKSGGQAVNLFGQYITIGNTSPERMMASWVFLKFLTSPEVQAKWIQGSAYYPTRSDTLPLLSDYLAANPIWSVGTSFLSSGAAEPAWPSWTSVRREVGNTFAAILQAAPADIATLLADLNAKAALAVSETQ